jgi:hypothetical protein
MARRVAGPLVRENRMIPFLGHGVRCHGVRCRRAAYVTTVPVGSAGTVVGEAAMRAHWYGVPNSSRAPTTTGRRSASSDRNTTPRRPASSLE